MSDQSVHGSAVVIGDDGILIRGASGAGKSSLALALTAAARAEGRFARLIADDRVILSPCHGRIVMRTPSAIAGLVEVRGAGLAKVPHLDAALLRLIVDIDASAPRYPEEEERRGSIHGIAIRRLITRPEMGVTAVMHILSGGLDNTAVTQ
jgi:serine kinase of HPr protein (carbohydrate metabolism regulator)